MKLDDLTVRIARCRICRDRPEGSPLPHEPRPVFQAAATARILIAGQAPGTRVHQSGRPFTDPSGDRLRAWLAVTQEEFYDASRFAIIPMGFCFPGQDERGADLPPRRECAPAWRQGLINALPRIALILAVGTYAQRWHLGQDARPTLTESVADWRVAMARSPPVIPLPHPSWRNNAWLRNNPWFEQDLLPVLREAVRNLLQG
jgi:uracil-DNA glycosylase